MCVREEDKQTDTHPRFLLEVVKGSEDGREHPFLPVSLGSLTG